MRHLNARQAQCVSERAAWSVDAVYTATGLLMAASVLGFVRVPRFKEFLGTEHSQIVDWYAHQYPEVFRTPARSAAPLGSNG